ncbi:MAG: class I SAM-dependent methyltransferase [Oscillospiraceae bacterium]|nr:class I SAM-dependent methyltransferase [Oscillospiraceae bacterium]
MKPDYQNWMPVWMVRLAGGAAAVCLAASALLGAWNSAAGCVLLFCAAAAVCAGGWMICMRRTFSYHGKRQLSKHIIETVATHVTLPDGGVGLDVGCGSGALTIACAKRNPNATFVGVDPWGDKYPTFSRSLCEQNARAENASNVTFVEGDATALAFPDETFDAVVSNYVYHNIPSKDRQAILLETLRVLKKGGTFAIHDIFSKSKYGDMRSFIRKLRDMGYESVELIDTTGGRVITKWEAVWMGLSGSALLVGKK